MARGMSLHELHDELEAEMAPPLAPGFKVTDQESADWALRKLAKARRDWANAVIVADAERARIDGFLERKRAELDHDESYFAPLLEGWHREVLEDNPKAKTVTLPAGKLRARQLPDEWVFDEKFIEWAQAEAERADALLRVKVEPDKNAAKKAFRPVVVHDDDGTMCVVIDPATGETVPGVAWREGDVRFSCETS